MSVSEVDRIKNLVNNDLVVAAVELPSNHRHRPLAVDDIEEVLARFDDDVDYAHFVIRVKRSTLPLPRPETADGEAEPQVSFDAMLNETLELQERITESRTATAAATEAATAEYDPEFLLENAKILEDNGDMPLARNIFQALVRRGLMIPQGLAGMARTYEKEGLFDRAVRCYQEAIAYSSEYPFYQAMAAIQIRQGNDRDAAQSLLHALGLVNLSDSQKFDLHKSLGNCYTRVSEHDKAEHHYLKAYELGPNSDVLQVNVGSLALQKGDHAAAQKHFERALELNSGNDKAISGLGMVELARRNLAQAHDHFVSSLKLNLGNLSAIFNLVKCAYELKRFDDASMILQRYIGEHPVNTNILYSYAGILFHLGNYAEAMVQAKKILDVNASHSGAKELLERIQAKQTG